MRSRTLGAVALVATTALAGCGGSKAVGDNAKNFSGEQKNVAQLVDDLQSAARAGDTTKICKQIFTPALAQVIATRAKTTCQIKVAKELPRNEKLTITQLTVVTPNGLATVSEQNGKVSHLTFVKQSGQWRVSSIQ